jgi:hypothetical protein
MTLFVITAPLFASSPEASFFPEHLMPYNPVEKAARHVRVQTEQWSIQWQQNPGPANPAHA